MIQEGHVEQEERGSFPLDRSVLSTEELEELGEETKNPVRAEGRRDRR